MGYQNENSTISRLVFDFETVSIQGAAQYLPDPEPPGNYKNPEAIAKWVEQARADQLDKAALDIDLARIVALGLWHDGMDEPAVLVCKGEDEERYALGQLWDLVRIEPRPRLIGYNLCHFDLPLALRRSLYLGIDAPQIETSKYRHPDVDDLELILSFNGDQKMRGLQFYRKRFGLDVPADESTGADVARLYAEGKFDEIAEHCRCDVLTTKALYERVMGRS
jgi:hypothetical protein